MSKTRISTSIRETNSLSPFKFHFPLFLIVIAFLLLPSQAAFSAQIKLAWDPNTESDLAGYKVYYGTASHSYGTPINVGNLTTYTLAGLTSGQTYYIAVTAYDTSNNESGFSNEVSGAATNTAQTYSYTIASNPAGLQITVDGTTYTAPQTFNWTAGSSHTVSSPSPQGGTGTRYVFASWSDGGAQSHTITAPSTSTTYTVNLGTQYSLTTSASPSAGGTVSPSGATWYNAGQSVSVSATANAGYSFSSWTGDLTGSTSPASLTMGGPKSVTASFTQNQYTLTASTNPASSGSVTKNPDKPSYVYGEQVLLTATAISGYAFSQWSGSLSGTNNPATLTMNGNKGVTANFSSVTETVSAPVTPNGTTSGVTGTNYSYAASGASSNMGHTVEYQFDWKGDGTDLSSWGPSGQSKTWTLAGSYQVKARARCTAHTSVVSNWSNGLSVGISQAGGTQAYTVSSSVSGLQVTVDDANYSTPQTFQWVPGSSHKLSAQSPQNKSQGSRFVFTSWSDGGGQTHTVNVPSSSTTYNANFKNQNKIKLIVSPSDAGTVSLSSSGATSGSTPIVLSKEKEEWYDDNDTVTLVATANPGYSFSEWSGDYSGKNNSASLSMKRSMEIVANFVVASETVSTPTPPNGPVSSNPGASNSYSTGGAISSSGHPVQYQFDWKGDESDLSQWGASPQSKAWSSAGAYLVRARARCSTHPSIVSSWSSPLSVSIGQTGTVCTVSTNPSGLQIAIDGTTYRAPQTFNWSPGSSHTLSVPITQSETTGTRNTYSSWSDGGGQTHTITTPSSSMTYTANFKTEYSLTTSVSPSAGGSVSPSGVNWYNSGQNVTISATANSGYRFSGWSGDLSATTNPVSVVMTGPKNVTANLFEVAGYLAVTPALGLSASGPSGGPFSPSSRIYTLENRGGAAINWSTSKTQSWISLSSNSGSLAPGTSTTVTVSINSNSNILVAGSYSDTITFNNTTQGGGNTSRAVALNIGSVNQGYTVTTDPPGLFVVVDGLNYRAPETFNWTPGSSHTVSITSPQFGPSGSQYAFGSWNDGGGQSHTLTTPSTGAIYVASFITQYSLTTFISPAGGGQVNLPVTNWYNHGESVLASATASTGYNFTGWSGDLSSVISPTFIVMNGPKIITANFTSDPCSLTPNVNPPGSGVITRDPEKVIYANGEQVTLTARANEGYIFKDWSGGVAGETNLITLSMKGNITATANFIPSGFLEVTPLEGLSASGRQGGDFSPSSQVYTIRNRGDIPIKWKVAKKPRWTNLSLANGSLAPGETVQVTVSINDSVKQVRMGSYNAMVTFKNAARGSDSISRSIALTVKPPIKTYTIKTNPDGLQVIVDGVPYVSPRTFDWEVGSSHTFEARTLQGSSPGSQYAFSSWSDRKPQIHNIVAPSRDTSYVANFKMQYSLTTSVNSPEGGVVTPSGTNWVNQGQKVSVNAKPNSGYKFLNWSGDVSGSSNPSSVTLDRPMNLVANFQKVEAQAASASSQESANSKTSPPMIGELESPSEGKRVFGLKTIYGWALDNEGISRVRLFIDGEYVCDIPYGGLREDLKEDYPDYPNAEKGGFALVWNYSSLSSGVHVVQVETQNMKGEVLRLSANILVQKLSGDIITQVNPKEWLIPGVNFAVDGSAKTYDLRLEWSNETQAFEIVDLYAQ
ncbi:MAG TPA: fibronectin type III domain-containing protein [Thermodesulfobacteriota bacterium]|nr:fibronectin type III domain-containing protein [Thermodesulfobacteriota bacterium]